MMTDEDVPVPVQELPEGHIFRLIYREDQPEAEDRWADLRRPIDIDLIIARLRTIEGRAETRQWVRTGIPVRRRLFLHQLVDCNIGNAHSEREIVHLTGEAGLLAIKLALEAYPNSIRMADSEEFLPLHISCTLNTRLFDSMAPGTFTDTTKQIFTVLLDKYPEGASTLGHSFRTVLGCVLNSTRPASGKEKKDRDDIIMTLLDLFPSAAEIPEGDGRYPLHMAWHESSHIVKRLIQLYPQALEKKCNDGDWGGRTPLLTFLRFHPIMSDDKEKIYNMILSVSPSCVSIEDSYTLTDLGMDIDPAGDALDYACHFYSDELKGLVFRLELLDEDEFERAQCVGGYVVSQEAYLKRSQRDGPELYRMPWPEDEALCSKIVRRNERIFDLILRVGHIMNGYTTPFRPLHILCKGRRCRPWYLAVIDQIILRYPTSAEERDGENNLPLHLFLESCMVEKERSKEKGYVSDDDEYFKAVRLCFKLIIDAYPGAASARNGDGFLPVHIVIRHCNSLKFEDVLGPLLELSPDALLARDPETRLHPFAQASIGHSSNLDTAFLLLRRDPTAIEIATNL